MRPFSSARVSVVTLAAILALSVSALAQNAPSLVASAQAAAAQAATQPDPSGPVRRLSVDDAVKLALEQNLGIRIQRIDPQIQDLGVAQVRGFWAPNLTSSAQRNALPDRPPLPASRPCLSFVL